VQRINLQFIVTGIAFLQEFENPGIPADGQVFPEMTLCVVFRIFFVFLALVRFFKKRYS